MSCFTLEHLVDGGRGRLSRRLVTPGLGLWTLGLALVGAGMLVAGARMASAAGQTVTVKMQDTPPRFLPEKLRIKVGDTIEWVNDAGTIHSVTDDPQNAQRAADVSAPAGAALFNSGFMPPGAKFGYTFTMPGHYKYVCVPHEQDDMIGEVDVTK